MKISFHGADQSVTGFIHLVECVGKINLRRAMLMQQ